jgi:pentatricopeptide repeat protein
MLPSVDHFNCVIDLLVRARKLDEAEHLLVSMGIEPTVVSWTTLLGTCRAEADVHRGERIVKHVLMLDAANPAHHVTLANIYAAAGEVNEATKIMDKLKEMDPLESWIE